MNRPEILMIGPYPDWDMAPLEDAYRVHKLWQADNKDSLIDAHAADIRAIATRGELGAKAELMAKCRTWKSSPAMAWGPMASISPGEITNSIRVTNTPDVLTGDVADIALGLLISVARQNSAG